MDKGADRTGIVALAEAIERAWNAGDVKSYARLYARLYALNAVYVTRAGIVWKGRTTIERGHAAAFRGELKGTVLKIRIKRLRFLTAKNAVAQCAVELSEDCAAASTEDSRRHPIRTSKKPGSLGNRGGANARASSAAKMTG